MDFYNGKLALITGGSSGIGFRVAEEMVKRGSHIAILARRKDRIALAIENLNGIRLSQSQRVIGLQADVVHRLELEQILDDFVQQSGLPDILVNCAGVAHPGTFTSLKPEIFDWMMDVNYFGTVNVLKCLVPAMKLRRSGNIVNISSVAGFIGVYGYTAYGASKFAISGLSDALRAELKPFGVHLSVVFPPDTDTPQLDYEKKFKPYITHKIAGSSNLMSAETVAREIIHKVARGKYLILPGLESKLLYHGHNILGQAIYPIMDQLIRSAITQIKPD